MPPQFSPYALLSQMRLSNYMSSPSFDRGMEQGPQGGGGGFMSTPFMPTQRDVGMVQSGQMPNFQPMPNDNPLGQFQGIRNGQMYNNGLFGGHPLLQHVLGNALGFMGNFQQGETTGENIGNVARGLLGVQAFPRQAAMGRFEGAFNVANQLDQLKQRQAMSDYYSGRGDYYQLKNEYEQRFHDQADQTKRDIDAANNQTKQQIEGMRDQSRANEDALKQRLWNSQADLAEARARAAGKTAGESMTRDQAKYTSIVAGDPEGKTPQGRYARNWLNTMIGTAGGVAGARADATGKDANTKEAEQALKSIKYDPNNKVRMGDLTTELIAGKKFANPGDSKSVLSQLNSEANRRNAVVDKKFQEWKSSYNPNSPYGFGAYWADYTNSMKSQGKEPWDLDGPVQGASPMPTSNAASNSGNPYRK